MNHQARGATSKELKAMEYILNSLTYIFAQGYAGSSLRPKYYDTLFKRPNQLADSLALRRLRRLLNNQWSEENRIYGTELENSYKGCDRIVVTAIYCDEIGSHCI